LSANCSTVLAINLVGLAFVQVTEKVGPHPDVRAGNLPPKADLIIRIKEISDCSD
jgi:hypothetical protein